MALSATASEALAPVRNAFYLGNLQDCQREARALMDKRNPSLQAMPEVYFFRSLIQQQKFDAVAKGVTAGSPVAVQILKLLAQFKQASVDARDGVFSALSEFLIDEATSCDPTVRLIAAQIHLEDGNFKEALKLVHDGDTLEMMALCVNIYLAMNRFDLAEKQVKAMQDTDDDDTLTQLSLAWYYVAVGGDKMQEAYLILQEQVEKFGPSIQISNSLGVCQLAQKHYSEAFELFKEARELAQQTNQPVSADTLVNTIVCLHHLRRNAEVPAVVSELEALAPNHPWLLKQVEMRSLFDKVAESFSA